MKVKMLVQTRLAGKVLHAGDEIEVNDKIASRWERARISVIIEKKEKKPADMTAKELYKLCIDKGIEVAEKQPKEVYLEALGVVTE